MLKKRLIPCLDIAAGRVVKGTKFLNLRDAGDPVELARFYDAEGADELCFLDITASHEKRKTLVELVEQVAHQVFIPFTVGGGISSVEDMDAILQAGADKITINTFAVKKSDLITAGAKKFGSQCIVLAIDVKKQETEDRRQEAVKWKVITHGGRTDTGLDVIEWARRGEALGAGEILLTSMDADGTKNGYDLALTEAVAASVNIPIIASGGAGTLQHFYEVLTSGKADAALAASLFHFKETSVAQVKKFLHEHEVPVRL
jgi:cyclase